MVVVDAWRLWDGAAHSCTFRTTQGIVHRWTQAAVLGGLTVGPAAVNAAVLELPRGSGQAVVVQITAEAVRR